MENRTKTNILTAAVFIFIVVLFILAFTGMNASRKAYDEKAEAEKTAASYAAALAEAAAGGEGTAVTVPVIDTSGTENENADHSKEAEVYAGFTAEDQEIRNALSALTQDDPDLVKNYRIRVDLKKMETVTLPEGEGRRVRFTGNFDRGKKRECAVIRINGESGTHTGKIYLANLKFNDEKTDLSELTKEDVSLSTGASLISADVTTLMNEGAVVLDTAFTGNSENDRVSIRLPLKGKDPSGFETVYYDLYFEGTDSDLTFTTGCDFAGKTGIASDLDEINRAFVMYRGKAAAGQDPEEERLKVLSALEGMREKLKEYPETDPLVIRINQILDDKTALIGEDPEGSGVSAESKTEPENNDSPEEADKTKNKTGVVTPALPNTVPQSAGDGEKTSLLPVLAVLSAILCIACFLILLFSVRKEREETFENARENTDRTIKKAEEEKEELRSEAEALENRLSEVKKRISSAGTGKVSSYPSDPGEILSLAEELNRRAEELSLELTETADPGAIDEDRPGNVSEDIRKTLDTLSGSNASLGEQIKTIASHLEETGRSVKDINKAATIISDIASETNLLSLNASIEAARAGASGRGFAVVADEISKLSDETEKSVTEITETVNRLNSDFDETGRYMDGILKSTDGQEQMIREARERLVSDADPMNSGMGAPGGRDLISIESKAAELSDLAKKLSRGLSDYCAQSEDDREALLNTLRETESLL